MTYEKIELPLPNGGFLTEPMLADRWVCSRKYLQKLRYQGGGPRYFRLSHNLIRYAITDVVAYENDHVRISTSDVGPINASSSWGGSR